MVEPFSSMGKQVLLNGEHFADVRDPEAAQAVTILLNKGRLLSMDTTDAEVALVKKVVWS